MSVSVHNAQTLRFMLTGVIGLRSLRRQKQVNYRNAYTSPFSLIKHRLIEHVIVATLKKRSGTFT